jgi:branched-chain amino acid transport system substrate-binding protein
VNPATRRRVLKYAGAAGGTVAIAGCSGNGNDGGGNDGGGSGGDSGTGTDVRDDALAGETIKLGVFTDADAARMAVDEINQNGGVLGAEMEVLTGSSDSPADARNDHRRLTFEEGADATFGLFFDPTLRNLMESMAEQQTLHLTTGAAGYEISQVVKEDYEAYKYHFRVGPINSRQLARGQLEFLDLYADDLGWDRVGFLIEDLSSFNPFEDEMARASEAVDGIEVVYNEVLSQGLTNWTPVYDELEAENADVAMVTQALSGTAAAQQWVNQERPFEFGGIHVPAQFDEFWSEIQGTCEYIFTMNAATPQSTNTELTQPFVESYVDTNGSVPIYSGFIMYDAVRLYAQAIRQAGTTDSDALVSVLEGLTFDESVWLPQIEFQGPDEEFPHDPVWSCMERCEDASNVPVWQQWQWDPEVREDRGTMHAFAPEPVASTAYQKPDWI